MHLLWENVYIYLSLHLLSMSPFIAPFKNGFNAVLWCCYRPQRSWGKVIFSQASVILSTGGGVVSQHALQEVSQHALQQGGVLSQHALQVVSQHALQQGECAIPSCLAAGEACSRGGLLRGVCAWWRPPPGRPLLRVVRILLECILVYT